MPLREEQLADLLEDDLKILVNKTVLSNSMITSSSKGAELSDRVNGDKISKSLLNIPQPSKSNENNKSDRAKVTTSSRASKDEESIEILN